MADLITRTDYKKYLGITTNNRDAEIDLLIPKISQLIKTYCRRTFVDYYGDLKTEVYNGGFNKILLQETPVVSIDSFSISTDYGQTYTALTEFTDYVLDGDILVSLNSYGFREYLRGYQIVYYGGYDTVPEDLQLAAFDLLEYYTKNNSAVHVNRDVTPNVTQIQYVASTNFPAHIKRVLDQYIADYA